MYGGCFIRGSTLTLSGKPHLPQKSCRQMFFIGREHSEYIKKKEKICL